MPTIEDLGKKVKAKYPGVYDDLSDVVVGAKVKAKYPGSYDDFTDVQESIAVKKPSILEQVGQKRGTELNKIADAYSLGEQGALRSGAQATGQVLGGAADILGAGVMKGLSAITPDFIEKPAVAAVTRAISSLLNATPYGKAIAPGIQKLEETNTAGSRDIKSLLGAGNFAATAFTGGLGATAGEKALASGAKAAEPVIAKAVKGADELAKTLTRQSEKQLESKVLSSFQKGVKPTIAGKKSLGQLDAFKADVLDAVKTIKNNTPNISFIDEAGQSVTGQAPKTLKEFSEAIDQTKKTVFKEYDALAKQAGKAGVEVKTNPIASELDTVIGNKALSITNPKAIQYAKQLKDRLSGAKTLDAETAQEVIQNYNQSLSAFYRNPTYDNASQAAVDALVANKMREALDKGITGLTGQQYSALKKQYGSLKAIEQDVLKATLRDARKNTKGLIDFSDILSGGQVINGILSMNPATIAQGLTQKAIAGFYKHLNDPNRAIENLFKAAGKL